MPVYNSIAEQYDLTVMYSDGEIPENCQFKTIFVPIKRIKHFYFHMENIRSIAVEYDIVIGMMSFNWISNYMLAFGHRGYKFISWGIGVPASYSVRYDDPKKKISSSCTKLLIKYSDAAVFYSEYPREKYSRLGVDSNKMFVAYNTVGVMDVTTDVKKDSVMFIGTLYKAKQTRDMLKIYYETYKINHNIPIFRIIGDGDEFEYVKKWIDDNGMNDVIVLEGAIYDENILANMFSRAYACISLGQAGLSVQKAMGYGVPYITMANAYTGGERLDIENGKNGFLLNDEEDLKGILIDIVENPGKYIKAGEEAYNFYHSYRTIGQMSKGVMDALLYVGKVDQSNRAYTK